MHACMHVSEFLYTFRQGEQHAIAQIQVWWLWTQVHFADLTYLYLRVFRLHHIRTVNLQTTPKMDCSPAGGDKLQIPSWIGNLSNLGSIEFWCVEHTDWPEEVNGLSKLTNLFVSPSKLLFSSTDICHFCFHLRSSVDVGHTYKLFADNGNPAIDIWQDLQTCGVVLLSQSRQTEFTHLVDGQAGNRQPCMNLWIRKNQ